MTKRRVVITGVGLVTPVGLDPDSTWSALVSGVSGAGPISRFDPSNQSVRFACEVKGFEPERYMDRKDARRADRFLQLAMAAAAQAVDSAGFGEGFGDLSPDRVGVIIGSGIG
ncbi:MAG: beta-ketoacyl synthase N-terminal-like domain-containing protein, partial [Gemmatimonadota bacterium]